MRAKLSERGLTVLLAAITAAGPVSLGIYMPVLPLARADFHVSVAAASMTVTAALVAYAIGLFAYGPLSDRYGRRPVILTGLTVYLVGVLLALLATSIGMLTVARVIAALGTSAGVTVARAVLGDLYAREHMATRLATISMVMSIASALSPALGGVLGDLVGWRIIFAIQVVLAVVVGLAALRWLPETLSHGDGRRADGVLRASARLAKDRAFIGFAVQTSVLYAIFFVFVSLVPYIFRNLGRSSAEYGSWYVLLAFSYFCGNWYTTRHSFRMGLDRLISTGIWIQAVGAVLGAALAWFGLWQPIFIFFPWFLIAFAQGLTLPNLTAAGVGRSTANAGAASGMLGFGQQIIGALAVQGMANADTKTPIAVTTFIAGGALLGATIWWLTPLHTRMPPTHPLPPR